MKKIIFLFCFIAIVLPRSFAQSKNWQKISINTSDDLKKIIVIDGKTIIFSNDKLWKSSDLLNWEQISIPESYSITPVVFKGRIYINSISSIYTSSDAGQTWQASNSVVGRCACLTANENTLFAFKDGKGATSYKSDDGVNFQVMENLVLPSGYMYPDTYFEFAKAGGDTIICSVYHPLSMYAKYFSYDNGENWTRTNAAHNMLITDVAFRYDNEFIEVGLNQGQVLYLSSGYANLCAEGGKFYAVENYYYNFWLAGLVTSQDGSGHTGMIMSNMDITHIFYCPEVIRALKYNDPHLIAVGDAGAVYVLGEVYTSLNKYESSDETLEVFPNPSSGEITIRCALRHNEQIIVYNAFGSKIKNFVPKERETTINLSEAPGAYLVRYGSANKKIILAQ